MADAAAIRDAYRGDSQPEIDMKTLTSQQTEQIHGAGSVEAAVLRWYLATLGDSGIPRPFPLGDTLY
jgi:hypothetical protein